MENKNIRIIVAHPGKQHSYWLAGALEKAGCLSHYITTVYDSNSSLLMRIIKKVVSNKNRKRANCRSTDMIPLNKVKQFCELQGLLVLAVLRIDKKKIFYSWYNDHVSRAFGKRVASFAIKQNVDAVICYDTSAMYCFEILEKRAPSITRIIDNAAMNRYGLCKIYQELDQKFGILRDRTGYKPYLLDERKAMKYKNEALMANYHIVASSFSKFTLTSIGIEEKRVAVIPYGVKTDQIPPKKMYSIDGKLKVLYVGEISPQKGIYNLIEMIEEFKESIEFHIVGSGLERLSIDNQRIIKEQTVFHGYLLQEELFSLYSDCDVFIFPSLGDGFGFVVIEAMAAGLPVICSSNSVAKDAIKDGVNGFVFQAGNSDELNDRIMYFINNRSAVVLMGRNAVITGRSFTWDRYYSNMKSFISQLDL